MTQNQVAKRLHYDARTVRAWTRAGLLTAVRPPGRSGKPGKRLLYSVEEVERFEGTFGKVRA